MSNIAACCCDRIVRMKAGKIVDVGPPEEMFVPEKIRYLFGVDTQITINSAAGKPDIVFIPSADQ